MESKKTDSEVYSGAYNECSGVSDVIYYNVDSDKFTVGAGRGGGWNNDPNMVELMEELGKGKHEYATVTDYQGCGLFSIDRGHQAPVGSFNENEAAATMTNTPTNLSPQNGWLNQKPWMYLEKEMRVKAVDNEDADVTEIELLTGPLYELPEEFFKNRDGKASWKELLVSGGEVNKKVPWCKNGYRGNWRSKAGSGRTEQITCENTGRSKPQNAYDNLNKVKMHYQRKPANFPLRIPLGYYKLAVLHDSTSHNRQTCPYIMDQTGQCILVSLELLMELAHIDLSGTEFAELGGLKKQKASSEAEYSAQVDPSFCIKKGGTLDKKKLCYTGTSDATSLKMSDFDKYWRERNGKKIGR